MKTYAAIIVVITAFLSVAIVVLTGGCNSQRAAATSDTGGANADTNLVKAQIDKLTATAEANVKATADIKASVAAEVAAIRNDIKANQTAKQTGDNNQSNQNTGGFIYAPVAGAGAAAAGCGALLLWLRHLGKALELTSNTEIRTAELELERAKLDLERDKHMASAFAGLRGCQAAPTTERQCQTPPT